MILNKDYINIIKSHPKLPRKINLDIILKIISYNKTNFYIIGGFILLVIIIDTVFSPLNLIHILLSDFTITNVIKKIITPSFLIIFISFVFVIWFFLNSILYDIKIIKNSIIVDAIVDDINLSKTNDNQADCVLKIYHPIGEFEHFILLNNDWIKELKKGSNIKVIVDSSKKTFYSFLKAEK